MIFHPSPIVLVYHMHFSEITGLIELKFHMEYNTIQKEKSKKYDIYLRLRDENGHNAHICETKYA